MKKILLIILLVSLVSLLGCSYKIENKSQPSTVCENFGGSIEDLEECNGEISKICSMPNGETCYLENFHNGKCEGIFSPKILCDTDQ